MRNNKHRAETTNQIIIRIKAFGCQVIETPMVANGDNLYAQNHWYAYACNCGWCIVICVSNAHEGAGCNWFHRSYRCELSKGSHRICRSKVQDGSNIRDSSQENGYQKIKNGSCSSFFSFISPFLGLFRPFRASFLEGNEPSGSKFPQGLVMRMPCAAKCLVFPLLRSNGAIELLVGSWTWHPGSEHRQQRSYYLPQQTHQFMGCRNWV